MLTLLDIDETLHSTLQERAIIPWDFTPFYFLQNNHSADIIWAYSSVFTW